MKIKIEKGIPIAKRKGGNNGKPCKYPWSEMKAGDSFWVKGWTRTAAHAAARDWARRHDPTRSYRTATERDGLRIWRVS